MRFGCVRLGSAGRSWENRFGRRSSAPTLRRLLAGLSRRAQPGRAERQRLPPRQGLGDVDVDVDELHAAFRLAVPRSTEPISVEKFDVADTIELVAAPVASGWQRL